MFPQLFDQSQAGLKWSEFRAQGFQSPVCGVIYKAGQAVCGLPLGGIGTGCMDLNTDGSFGRCSIFNSFAPPRELNSPFLALATGGKTWVLAKKKIPGVESAQEVHYWGHFPVADLEFKTSSCFEIGLRAWCLFLPGDSVLSNTPGAVFEVHIRNSSNTAQKGILAFSFPGPTNEESGDEVYERTEFGSLCRGIAVKTPAGVGYALAILGNESPRHGALLDFSAPASRRLEKLRNTSEKVAGATIAIDFELNAHEHRIIRFALGWFNPRWKGTEFRHYLHRYSDRFSGPEKVVEYLAAFHGSLLKRVLAWQETIYLETQLPVWLRDQMVNILHTISEDSFWALNSIPREDWCGTVGIFGLTESPRSVPHVAIPSDWYGSLPLVFFFPDLMAALLRGYAHFQLGNGEIPLGLGWGTDLGSPIYHFLHTVNSAVFVDLVGRLWQRGNKPEVLSEFYPSVKKAIEYTKSLDRDNDGLLDLEPEPTGNQFYGAWRWPGTSAHTNGFWLPILKLGELMADASGDPAFSKKCREWHSQAQSSLESLWNGTSYQLYRDRATGQQSDTILANQLVGQWLSFLHGLPLMFTPERAAVALKTVTDLLLPKSSWGIYNALRPDGAIDPSGDTHSTGCFPGENLCVAMTLIYSGDRCLGEALAKRVIDNLVLRQGVEWDMPNQINPETGEVSFGTDFYQMMIIWGLPLALSAHDIPTASGKGSLIDRILKSAQGAGARPESLQVKTEVDLNSSNIKSNAGRISLPLDV